MTTRSGAPSRSWLSSVTSSRTILGVGHVVDATDQPLSSTPRGSFAIAARRPDTASTAAEGSHLQVREVTIADVLRPEEHSLPPGILRVQKHVIVSYMLLAY